jgi:hypothetical protein
MDHHPLTAASSADEAYVQFYIKRCADTDGPINGFYFARHLVRREGYDVVLFAGVSTPVSLMDDAMLALKMKYDVAHSTILIIPDNWLPEHLSTAVAS